MTDGQILLAAILADPDDDAPRLVYADWLDEHGESERAELIRIQCVNPPKRSVQRWGAGLAGVVGQMDSWQWFRGFIEYVSCSAADWLAHGDAILAAHPVTEVRLTTMPGGDFGGLHVVSVRGEPRNRLYHPRWPSVRTWHLPPEPLIRMTGASLGRGRQATVRIGDAPPIPLRSVRIESLVNNLPRHELETVDGRIIELIPGRGPAATIEYADGTSLRLPSFEVIR